MSWFSRAVDKVSSAAAYIDPTANQSGVGKLIGPQATGVIKAGVSSSLTVVTGGADLLVRPDLKDSTIRGFQLGASGPASVLSASLPQPTKITIGQPSPAGNANGSAPIVAVPASKLKTLALFGLAFLVILFVARED